MLYRKGFITLVTIDCFVLGGFFNPTMTKKWRQQPSNNNPERSSIEKLETGSNVTVWANHIAWHAALRADDFHTRCSLRDSSSQVEANPRLQFSTRLEISSSEQGLKSFHTSSNVPNSQGKWPGKKMLTWNQAQSLLWNTKASHVVFLFCD